MQCGSVRFSALFGGQGLTSLGCHGCRDATTPDDITLSYDITMTFGISRPPEFCEACGRANDASVEPCSFSSGTPRSKSRRLTAPNAKSPKMFPREHFGLHFSPDSKTHKTPKRRRQAASPLDNGHSGQHPPAVLGTSDGCSERSECVWA